MYLIDKKLKHNVWRYIFQCGHGLGPRFEPMEIGNNRLHIRIGAVVPTHQKAPAPPLDGLPRPADRQ